MGETQAAGQAVTGTVACALVQLPATSSPLHRYSLTHWRRGSTQDDALPKLG